MPGSGETWGGVVVVTVEVVVRDSFIDWARRMKDKNRLVSFTTLASYYLY